MLRTLFALAFLATMTGLFGQNPLPEKAPSQPAKETPPKKWYDKISIRGYTQIRYNRLLETNPDLKNEAGDRSIGSGGGFFLRRGRLVFSGDVHDRVFIYIQPDFGASASTTGLHFFQIRDAYFDLALDKKKAFRLRFGQSKVPFGFVNMQSSSNRIAIDRDDALNSGVPNERDLGLFAMWAPPEKRALFAKLANAEMKGSGDYGCFSAGLYNGQTMGRPEANDNRHVFGRFSWPHELRNGQIVEAGVQGYSGRFVLPTTTAKVKGAEKFEYDDQRAAASLVLYPKPFGLTAEWNAGTGPAFQAADTSIVQKKLSGYSIMAMFSTKVKGSTLIPYARYQHFDGGKKAELDARYSIIEEVEIGAEWQAFKNFELTAAYVISHRNTSDFSKVSNDQKGNFLRLQAQFNY